MSLRTALLMLAVFSGLLIQPPQQAVAQSEANQSYVVFYIGATSCGPCNRPEVIDAVKKIGSEFSKERVDLPVKHVMVAMDENISEGISFLKKYGAFWDEVSVGSFYHNEHALRYLNSQKPPGVPHVFVFKDTYEDAMHGVETVKERKLVRKVMGGDEIVKWVKKGFLLKTGK